MNLVVDTNVLISGLLWSGTPRELLEMVRDTNTILYFSSTTWSELNTVLHYPKLQRRIINLDLTVDNISLRLVPWTEVVEPKMQVKLIPNEPIDNEIIAVALTSHSDAIISGDHHLLDLKTILNIPILTPRQFLDLM
jgi:putative PIN family toxin of toxin-antitoxin system